MPLIGSKDQKYQNHQFSHKNKKQHLKFKSWQIWGAPKGPREGGGERRPTEAIERGSQRDTEKGVEERRQTEAIYSERKGRREKVGNLGCKTKIQNQGSHPKTKALDLKLRSRTKPSDPKPGVQRSKTRSSTDPNHKPCILNQGLGAKTKIRNETLGVCFCVLVVVVVCVYVFMCMCVCLCV